MKRILLLFCSCLVLSVMIGVTTTYAATYQVNSIVDLQARIDNAVAGDVIIVLNGVYTTNASITVNRQGTLTSPIRIIAKTVGGVEINGTHGFDIRSPAAHIEIDGFLFTHLSGRNQIRPGATHIRF